ncbi:MAG: 8-amino-7-oxononanoate synthase [Myxococcota bacterium]
MEPPTLLRLLPHRIAAGVNAKPIIFPAVADDVARLRLFLTTMHTEEQLLFSADLVNLQLKLPRKQLAW